ncbi:MAG: L-serine ammonia-lyase, iron-sulfur-dependent, subunit alpha [Erysipelotrichaceae bacterium]|nr:L-serine ammonia-lyase, iron-sulfur-dependent, subunit alpha [Erysipelotrichaceae bacterium]
MERNDELYQIYISILEEELIPAMGCTEPIAIAYASAKAREVLGDIPDKVIIGASGSIIKNVKSVIVPNTEHLKGIPASAVAGIIAGDASKKLEVISNVSHEQIIQMKEYLDNIDIQVEYIDEDLIFDIVVKVYKDNNEAIVRIADFHTNIVHIEKNNEVLLDKPVSTDDDHSDIREKLNMKDIWEFINMVHIDDIKELLDKQISYNMNISNEGMNHDYGANIGKVLLDAYGHDIKTKAKAMAAAGSDARMNGCELPVVINSGSGNQGITCSVPVIVYAKELNVDDEKLYRALALSNLVAIHQKTGIGRLSAYCGAVSAGAAAGAGISYLNGGGYKDMTHTVVNALAITSGMICDGAKASCAAKIAASVDAGILGYEMYKHGQQFYGGDGIITKGIENTIHNVGRLGKDGMKETNKEIIKIMVE